MDREIVYKKIVEICKEIFDNCDLSITEETCADDIEEWDSLTHLSIISDIEEEFGISFTLDEMTNIRNLGELVNAAIEHISK